MLKNSYYITLMGAILLIFLAVNANALPITGNSNGVFTNATGPSAMNVTGEGTDTFTWGIGDPSWMTFDGVTFSGETDEVISFGTLTYYNGAINLATIADTVGLEVMLSFTDPGGINRDFSYGLQLINTPNNTGGWSDADYVYLPTSTPDTYFSYEGINYTLEFAGFGNLSSTGYTTIDQFHILEGYTASAQLLGSVTEYTAPVSTAPVPEPATMLLFSTGLVGLVGLRRKKFKK